MHSIYTPLRIALAGRLQGRILDCGSGEDLFGPYLRKAGSTVFSLDVDEAALRKTPGARVVASCARLPFAADTFDAVWACAVIEHVAEDTLPEMIRVTRPGGRVIAVTPNRHSPFDPILALCGMKTWRSRPGHVRLYTVDDLRPFGGVHGETRFVPLMRWFFWRVPRLAHVLIADIEVTPELKARFAAPRAPDARPEPAQGSSAAANPPPMQDACVAARTSASPQSTGRRLLVGLVRLALLAAVLYFVVGAMAHGFGEVPWDQINFSPVYLALAMAAALASKIVVAVTYRCLLGPAARSLRWPVLLAAAWIPPLGKYIPGKVASIAWAVVLLREQNVPGPVVVRAVFLQTGLSVALGLALAVPLLVLHPEGSPLPMAWAWVPAALAASVVVLHPRVFFAVSNFVLRRLGRPAIEDALGTGAYLAAAASMVGQWICIGLAMWFMAGSLQAVSVSDVPLFVAACSLATTIGFLALFAPAGLGVREGILLVTLGPVLGAGPAAVAIAAMRLLHVAAEAVLATIGYAMLRMRRLGGLSTIHD